MRPEGIEPPSRGSKPRVLSIERRAHKTICEYILLAEKKQDFLVFIPKYAGPEDGPARRPH